MDTYTIKKAYHWTNDLEISSENLLYVEFGQTHSGCQCNNIENQKAISIRCNRIADLIREIEILNKTE